MDSAAWSELVSSVTLFLSLFATNGSRYDITDLCGLHPLRKMKKFIYDAEAHCCLLYLTSTTLRRLTRPCEAHSLQSFDG
jgi:hypothetical protein